MRPIRTEYWHLGTGTPRGVARGAAVVQVLPDATVQPVPVMPLGPNGDQLQTTDPVTVLAG